MLGRDPIHEGRLLRDRTRAGEEAGALPAGGSRGATPRRRRLVLAAAFGLALAALLGLDWSTAVAGRHSRTGGATLTLRRAVNALRGPVRIGLQVGHLDASAMPPELASLRTSTGAAVGGLTEVRVNRLIVLALAARLRRDGFKVDVLDATVPVRYRADLVLAVHADASPDVTREGYKSAHFAPERNQREALLKLDVDRAVLAESGLGDDDRNVSLDMTRYYAFNGRRFRHAVARGTPGLIVELGYLTNARDRAILERPQQAAGPLADGVVRYLRDVGRLPPGDRSTP